jgi:DNA-binding XRE family transcriptional regulator
MTEDLSTSDAPLDRPLSARRRRDAFPSLLSWRLTLRLSQRQAAGVLGISQSTYARIEAGKAPPRPALGKAISDRTGISFEVVMGVA